jgi:preprotein translocase subunit SecY
VVYLIFFMAFCTIFSIIWVTTSGMDADSVAGQIEELGLQIPGFRRDPRIIREVLNRYIPILAVLGGLTVGGLAAFADLTNAIGSGTGILLTVMIIYNFYEIIASRYVEEMHPGMRKFFA